jgi:hypothetical protein
MNIISEIFNFRVTVLQVILFLIAVVAVEIVVKLLIYTYKKRKIKAEEFLHGSTSPTTIRKESIKRDAGKGKYPVITLCGSTKFKDEFIRVQKELSLKGNIVLSVGLFGHSGDEEVWAEGTKQMLDEMHKAKIDLADEIFVIDVGGYIGESTKSEIEYAINRGIPVHYLSEKQ